jgi:hypothetical protein
MAGILKIYDIGALGVNVDSDPITLDDQEIRLAQNAIRDPLGADSGLRKRPGLGVFNTSLVAGAILGGIGVPLKNLSSSGTVYLYIGRGPTS